MRRAATAALLAPIRAIHARMGARNFAWFLLCALGTGLAGCLAPGNLPPREYYVLDDLAKTAASKRATAIDRVLLVNPTSVSPFYDTQSLAFSREPGQRAHYQFAAWTERPGRRFSELLMRRLDARGGFKSVTSTTSGVTVGAASGWRGAALDDALMRVTEFVQVVPRFFLAVVVIALFGPGLDRLVLLLGLTSWPLIARVVRAEVLSLKTREFVEAARSLGAPDLRILAREVLPSVLPSAVVVASVNAAGVILLEAGLSFLGLGDPDVVSLGYLASNAQRFLRVAWWMVVFPGGVIALAALGLNLLGDALNDALNPRIER